MNRYSWNYLKCNIKNNLWIGRSELKRDSTIQYSCDIHMHYVDDHYMSREDFIKIKYLKYDKRVIDNKIFAYNRNVYFPYNIIRNDYPYNVDKNIQHYVFWSIIEPHPLRVDFLCRFLPYNNFLWFTDDANTRSIKKLWHAQVFLK